MSKFEKLANEIKSMLESYDLFHDTRIYFDGKCYCSNRGFIEGIVASDYFEFANDETLSMSFEGPLYHIFNYERVDHPVIVKLEKIVNKYGYYTQPGHAWNLTLYEI